MNELIYEKEMECDFLALEYAISMIPLSSDTFMEDGDSNIFTKIKDKIKEIVDKFKEWINKFFNKDSKKEKEIEEAIEKNPKLKNKKVKIKDYDKLSKLEQDTVKDLKNAKSSEEVDKKMASYKKKRAAILAATVTVSLGAVFAGMKIAKNKRIKAVEETEKVANEVTKEFKFDESKPEDKKILDAISHILNDQTLEGKEELKNASDSLKRELYMTGNLHGITDSPAYGAKEIDKSFSNGNTAMDKLKRYGYMDGYNDGVKQIAEKKQLYRSRAKSGYNFEKDIAESSGKKLSESDLRNLQQKYRDEYEDNLKSIKKGNEQYRKIVERDNKKSSKKRKLL